jgi:hypothetical protein
VNWYGVLKLAAIDPKAYGYWVTDTGEAHPVYNQAGHSRKLNELLGTMDYTDAFEKGWVRVLTHTHPSYSNMKEMVTDCGCNFRNQLSQATVNTLVKIFKTHPCEATVYLNTDKATPKNFAALLQQKVKANVAPPAQPAPSAAPAAEPVAPATPPRQPDLTRQQLIDQARQRARAKVNPLKRQQGVV